MAQLVGGTCAILLVRALYPGVTPAEAEGIMLPHSERQQIPGATATVSRSI
jgi:hypothetical protein